MPGDMWQQFANLRVLYAYQYAHPGKKLLFMGQEFAQRKEWSETHSLDWHLLQYDSHRGIKNLVTDLNKLVAREPALHEIDFEWQGFEWIDANDSDNSVYSFIRRGKNPNEILIIVLNATPGGSLWLQDRGSGPGTLRGKCLIRTPPPTAAAMLAILAE